MVFRPVLALVLLVGCTANEADCDALGRHFIELSLAEARARDVAPESIDPVARTIADELIATCKAEPRRKRELECMTVAASLAELSECS